MVGSERVVAYGRPFFTAEAQTTLRKGRRKGDRESTHRRAPANGKGNGGCKANSKISGDDVPYKPRLRLPLDSLPT